MYVVRGQDHVLAEFSTKCFKMIVISRFVFAVGVTMALVIT